MFVAGQKQQLLWDLPPAETFELNRAIYGVSRESYRKVLDELIAVLELEPLLEKPTRQLSLGERMKCELAASLIHRPSVLFLDEPTIGLDVTMQAALRSFIRRYNEEHGATVLLTSHYMVDVAALAPRVLVIDHGRLTFDGLLADLVRRVHPYRRLTLRLGGPAAPGALDALGARVVSLSDGVAVLEVGEESLKPLIAQALERLPVVDLTVEEAPLEDVISELFTRRSGATPTTTGGEARAIATATTPATSSGHGRDPQPDRAACRLAPPPRRRRPRRVAWRALPVMLRVHFAEAIAWRAEFLIWVLAYTLPLIMLALWSAVAREAPVGRFGEREFRAYFLATLVFRLVAASWVVWDMSFQIRQGTIASRLLRPVHPLIQFAAQQAAAIPLRARAGDADRGGRDRLGRRRRGDPRSALLAARCRSCSPAPGR